MGKKKDIDELTTLLALAIAHRIGSIVNTNEIYAQKYALEGERFFKRARLISLEIHCNFEDRAFLKAALRKKLEAELRKRDFLAEEKFLHVEREIAAALEKLRLT